MRFLVLLGTVLLSAAMAPGHGGKFLPPPGTAPPPGTGLPPGPSSPGGAPPPGTAVTPPSTPPPPVAPPRIAPAAGTPSGAAVTGDLGPDLDGWETWWDLNKARFLRLRSAVRRDATRGDGTAVTPGSVASEAAAAAPVPALAELRAGIAPLLMAAASEKESQRVRVNAILALAKLGESSPPPAFWNDALQDVPSVAEAAVLGIGIRGSLRAVPVLREIAANSAEGRRLVDHAAGVPFRMRAFAIYALGIAAGRQSGDTAKAAAAETLIEILERDVSARIDFRVAAVHALSELRLENPRPAVDALAAVLDDPKRERFVRSHCPTAIAKCLRAGRRDDTATLAQVTRFLAILDDEDETPAVRAASALALGMLTDELAPWSGRVLHRLQGAVRKGASRQVKNFATIGIAHLAAHAAAGSPQRDRAVEFLLDWLDGGPGTLRPWCALALGMIGWHAAEQGSPLPAVVGHAIHQRFSGTSSPALKAAYALALGLLGFEPAAEDLAVSLLRSSNPDYVTHACLALGLAGDSRYRTALVERLDDGRNQPDVLRSAAIGLGLMSDPEVSRLLVERLRKEGRRAPSGISIAAVALALGSVGDHRAVAVLAEVLADETNTSFARTFAAQSLGMIVEPRDFAWNVSIGWDISYHEAPPTLVEPYAGGGILDVY